MTSVSLAVFCLIFLGICAVFAWRQIHVNKALRASRTNGRSTAPLAPSRLGSQFWWELALYGGGFVLVLYIFFGRALSVYLGYGDLS